MSCPICLTEPHNHHTDALTFEEAHGLLIEGHTLTTPATLDPAGHPEISWRIGVGDDGDPTYLIDGEEWSMDDFAHELAMVCAVVVDESRFDDDGEPLTILGKPIH